MTQPLFTMALLIALAQGMPFDQDRTTHHFVLRPDGGIIRVEVNTAADDRNREAIRAHARRIAADFAAGRFDAPFATHGEEPAGVAVMRARTAAIRYTVEDTPDGAAVRIVSTAPDALAAIHEFLRYQIREHRTGDPTTPHDAGHQGARKYSITISSSVTPSRTTCAVSRPQAAKPSPV